MTVSNEDKQERLSQDVIYLKSEHKFLKDSFASITSQLQDLKNQVSIANQTHEMTIKLIAKEIVDPIKEQIAGAEKSMLSCKANIKVEMTEEIEKAKLEAKAELHEVESNAKSIIVGYAWAFGVCLGIITTMGLFTLNIIDRANTEEHTRMANEIKLIHAQELEHYNSKSHVIKK